MNKAFDKKMAIVVIILSTGLMQIHSIPFWQKFTGDYYSGIAFSIALEAALLILGPWYQVSVPVFENLGTAKTSATLIESYREEADQLKASLMNYENNSKKYKRSANRVEPTQLRLDAAREKYRDELKITEKSDSKSRLYTVVAMLLLGFLSVMLTQISAVKFCRRPVSENTETGKGDISVISETLERVAAVISEKMKGYPSQAAFAASYSFNTRDVSNVVNGKPISKNKLKEMAEKLGMTC